MAHELRRVTTLVFPLDYPDPAGEFFGYDEVLETPDDTVTRDITAFVATVCWIATLLVGLRAGATVPARSQAAGLYRALVGDEWADLVDAV